MTNQPEPDVIRATESSQAVSRLDSFILRAESGPAPTGGANRLDLLLGVCRQVRTAITIPTANPHEQAARLAKVTALVAALRAGKITAELARTMDGSDWLCAAKAAGVHPPSHTTCQMVIDSLARSERILTAGGSR
jgi:hypothetical protein